MGHVQIIEGHRGHYSVHCECGWSSPENPNIETRSDANFEFALHISLKR